MKFRLPVLFTRAVQILRGKRLVPTSLGSQALRAVAAAVKRRAIFSARNTQLTVLQSVADAVAGMLEGRLNLADARLALAQSLDAAGYQPETGFPGDEGEYIPPAEPGSLRDLRSDERRDLVIKTQFRLAANEAAHEKATQDDVSLYQYPAYELVRFEGRITPRGFKRSKGELRRDPGQDWPSRFAAAGGILREGRMIALKGDGVWQALGDGAGGYNDTLGNPWSPFAYGSGYGLREVPRDECMRLGVLSRGEAVARVPRTLAADLRRDAQDLDPALLAAVAKDLEKQEDGSLRMRRILDAEVAAAEAAYAVNVRGRVEALLWLMNAGTSEGAVKGWATRRRGSKRLAQREIRRGLAAIRKVRLKGGGRVEKAMRVPGLGWVDIHYGQTGFLKKKPHGQEGSGILHVEDKHKLAAVEMIPKVLMYGRIIPHREHDRRYVKWKDWTVVVKRKERGRWEVATSINDYTIQRTSRPVKKKRPAPKKWKAGRNTTQMNAKPEFFAPTHAAPFWSKLGMVAAKDSSVPLMQRRCKLLLNVLRAAEERRAAA